MKIMAKNALLTFFLMTAAFAGFFTECASKNKETVSKTSQQKQIREDEQRLQNYYSENKPGKWANLGAKHSPEVMVSRTTNEILITATSPFFSQHSHYVEFILLTDYSLKEINKKVFINVNSPAHDRASAVFSLPVSSKGDYYVLLKCNLHDTWYKKIVLP